MSSFTSLTASLVLTILICAPWYVSSDCTSCCVYNTGCSTAYNGRPARCCGSGLLSFCCPTSTSCGTYPYCISNRYWGVLTLGELIGVIFGIVLGSIFIIAVCNLVCRRRRQQRTRANPVVSLPRSYVNPGACPPPPPAYQVSSKV
ncbi:hypothetical protein I4U23_015344 [Adineta vaga]|nr:hypothetical protein I4U23_015344 [Adineta vaga]